MFLKQIGSLRCIAPDMRMVYVRTTLCEAFKKAQLLPELPVEPRAQVGAVRSLAHPISGLENSLELGTPSGAHARVKGLQINKGIVQP